MQHYHPKPGDSPLRLYTPYDTPCAALLARLDGVRQKHPDRWIARCPGPCHEHGDRHPSLSIRERDDGAVLMHCPVGCENSAIVAALGLELRDLFPPRPAEHYRGPAPRSERPYLTMGELVALLRHSVTVVAIAAEDIAAGRALSPEDLETLRYTAADLHRLMEACHESG